MNPEQRPQEPHLQAVDGAQLAELEAAERAEAVASSANWLYWIVGLSIINSIVVATGAHGGFAVGLSSTYFLDYMIREADVVMHAMVYGLDVILLAFFAGMAFFASRGHVWAFLLAMGAYALDGLVDVGAFFLFGTLDPISMVVHVVVLCLLGQGVVNAFQMRKD